MSASKRASLLAAHPVYELFCRADAGVWHESSQTPVVANIPLNGGLVYVGERLYSRESGINDACLIQPSLPVEIPQTPAPYDDLNPHYAHMTPAQRGTWLRWLAGGRRDTNVDLSYVLLYFYGLERRLLIDGPAERFGSSARQSILNEILRMMRDFKTMESFVIIAQTLASLAWILDNNPHYIVRSPDYVDFDSPHSIDIFPWNLARFPVQHKPVPCEVMLQWYRNHPKFGLNVEVRRHYKTFLELFRPKFAKAFGEGIDIKPPSTPLILNYHAANPQTGTLYFSFPGIFDIFDDTDALRSIQGLVDECAHMLNRQSDEDAGNGNADDVHG